MRRSIVLCVCVCIPSNFCYIIISALYTNTNFNSPETPDKKSGEREKLIYMPYELNDSVLLFLAVDFCFLLFESECISSRIDLLLFFFSRSLAKYIITMETFFFLFRFHLALKTPFLCVAYSCFVDL